MYESEWPQSLQTCSIDLTTLITSLWFEVRHPKGLQYRRFKVEKREEVRSFLGRDHRSFECSLKIPGQLS
jgi:hypothetical protein